MNNHLLAKTVFAFVVTISSFFPIYCSSKEQKVYLSVLAIFRDEADYLKEWIEYHRLQGVERFYLYNNLSKDHYRETLQEYIDQGIVKLFEWPYDHTLLSEWSSIQRNCYINGIHHCKKQTEWLALLDTDEFLVPNQYDSVKEMLLDFEKKDPQKKYSEYYFNWVIFGTSGIYKVPKDMLMIELLTKRTTSFSLQSYFSTNRCRK